MPGIVHCLRYAFICYARRFGSWLFSHNYTEKITDSINSICQHNMIKTEHVRTTQQLWCVLSEVASRFLAHDFCHKSTVTSALAYLAKDPCPTHLIILDLIILKNSENRSIE
jgi:hypothetical protein